MDHAIGCDLADAMVGRIGDEEIAIVIDRNTPRRVQSGGCCRTVLIRKSSDARACNRSDNPGGRYLADAVAKRVGDKEVARRIEGAGCRLVELGEPRGTAIARI